MNTRLSRLVTMAQSMTEAERAQWLLDMAHEHDMDSEQYQLVVLAIKQARAVVELSIRTEVAHASDIVDGNGSIRPAGVRHEIVLDTDPAFVLVREVWFWSDDGEVRHADERRVGINDLVHIVVNMTDAERRFFAESRTTWPETDWEGIPR